MKQPAFLLLLVVSFLIGSCKYQEVELSDIRDFKVEKMENDRVYFSFSARVINPNSYALKISDTDLSLQVNRSSMGQLYLSKAIRIPAGNEDYIPVYASVKTSGAAQSILPVLLGSVFNRAVDITLQGEVKAGWLFFPRRIQINHTERIEWK